VEAPREYILSGILRTRKNYYSIKIMYSLRPLLLVPNMEVVYQLAVQIFFTESESASVTSQRPLIVMYMFFFFFEK
jgi:hypothetical protein